MHRLALVVLLALTGCSGGGRDAGPSPFTGPAAETGVSLRNESAQAVVYLAAGEGTLALLDIRPFFLPGEYDNRLVGPGRTAPVSDIIGYDPGLGVTFFIYLVDPDSRIARFRGSFAVSAAEIIRTRGVVRFTDSRL